MTTLNLLLWRHAEAEDGWPDLERALTPHGRKQAATVALWLRKHLPDDSQIIVSPALRTRQTADALARPYRIDRRIAPDQPLASILAAAGLADPVTDPSPDNHGEDGIASVRTSRLLIGHQPWIGQCAALLVSGAPQSWSVRKAALWWLVRRDRDEATQWTLRTVVNADLL